MNLFSGKVKCIEIPRQRAIDIDDIHDLNFAKYLYEKENKNILLLGGSGLIGNSLAQGLKDEGYNVIIFDLKKPKKFQKILFLLKQI